MGKVTILLKYTFLRASVLHILKNTAACRAMQLRFHFKTMSISECFRKHHACLFCYLVSITAEIAVSEVVIQYTVTFSDITLYILWRSLASLARVRVDSFSLMMNNKFYVLIVIMMNMSIIEIITWLLFIILIHN